MKSIKGFLLDSKYLAKPSLYIRKIQKDIFLYIESSIRLVRQMQSKSNAIFYLGIPAHNNLGDQAQGLCIRTWLKKHFSKYSVIEIETNALVNTRFSVLSKLQKAYKEGDLIVFQSGYTTTDLGGYADEMHRAVISILPNANMIMMPQTIFFKSKENERRTSESYDSAKNLLFIARDKKSYELAQKMFTKIRVELYPDIVTTLIGKQTFNNKREGILLCCRDDGEKYYSNKEIDDLRGRLNTIAEVRMTDTTKDVSAGSMTRQAEKYLHDEITEYSRYKLIITDRYHGTILSLVAGTPVIVIKTTDHKVVTGVDWFKGIYDDYVFYVDKIDDVFEYASMICSRDYEYNLDDYFESKYYDKLAIDVKKIFCIE